MDDAPPVRRAQPAFVEQVRALEARVRRGDLLDDDAGCRASTTERVGADVRPTRHFDRWWKQRRPSRDLLDLTADVLERGGGFRLADYPDRWRQGDLELPLTYRFDPGGAARRRHRPRAADRAQPGQRRRARLADPRVPRELVDGAGADAAQGRPPRLIPAAETTTGGARPRSAPPRGRLVDALAAALTEVSGVRVRRRRFDRAAVPAAPADELRRRRRRRRRCTTPTTTSTPSGPGWPPTARAAIAEAAPIDERRGIVDWDVGTLPQVGRDVAAAATRVRGYPALLDDDDSVSLRVLTNADLQQRVMRGGVRRLLLLTSAPSPRGPARARPGPAGWRSPAAASTSTGWSRECRVGRGRHGCMTTTASCRGTPTRSPSLQRGGAARTRRQSPPTRWRRSPTSSPPPRG